MFNRPEDNDLNHFNKSPELERPNGASVREQLAALEKPIAQQEDIEEFDTIAKRIEDKADEDVFKKPKKEKQELDKKVKIGMIASGVVVLIIIIIVAFMQIQSSNSSTDDSPLANSTDKITENSQGSGTVDEESNIETKLSVPGTITNVDELTEAITNINLSIVSYFEEMKTLVVDYNNRERNDIYIEDFMDKYKSAILSDIDILAKYKSYYDSYGASDLYLVTVDRFQNAYELARTAKNVMTEKALVNNTNTYIGKEEELNTRAKTTLISYLEYNNIDFSLEDDKIQLNK